MVDAELTQLYAITRPIGERPGLIAVDWNWKDRNNIGSGTGRGPSRSARVLLQHMDSMDYFLGETERIRESLGRFGIRPHPVFPPRFKILAAVRLSCFSFEMDSDACSS